MQSPHLTSRHEKHCQILERLFYGILQLPKYTVFSHEDGIAKPIPATVYGSALVHIRFPQKPKPIRT